MAQEFKISQRRRLIMVKGRQFISMELIQAKGSNWREIQKSSLIIPARSFPSP